MTTAATPCLAEKTRDENYVAEYDRWFREAPPALRAKLKRLQLDKPDLAKTPFPIAADGGEEDGADPAEWDAAQVTPDVAAGVDTLSDNLQERFNVAAAPAAEIAAWISGIVEAEAERRKAHQLHRVIAYLMRGGNVKLRVYALAFACKLAALNGLKNQTFAAKLLRVSRSAVSNCVNEWSDLLEVPRNENMKSQDARDRYSADKSTSHWRHRNFKPKAAK